MNVTTGIGIRRRSGGSGSVVRRCHADAEGGQDGRRGLHEAAGGAGCRANARCRRQGAVRGTFLGCHLFCLISFLVLFSCSLLLYLYVFFYQLLFLCIHVLFYLLCCVCFIHECCIFCGEGFCFLGMVPAFSGFVLEKQSKWHLEGCCEYYTLSRAKHSHSLLTAQVTLQS